MKCKFCQAEWDEEVTVCPVCGKDNSEAEECCVEESAVEESAVEEELTAEESCETEEDVQEETPETEEEITTKKKMTSGKLAVLYIAVIAVLAVLMAFVFFGMKGNSFDDLRNTSNDVAEGTVPEDGNPDDASCQGSYTVSNFRVKTAANKVVATGANGDKLTNEMLQSMYWLQVYNFMSNYDEAAFGVDFNLPLDQQICSASEDGWTWQQYFLHIAVEEWKMYQALCAEAEAVGFKGEKDMSAYMEQIKTSLEESALSQGYEDVDAMMKADMGAGATADSYLEYVQMTETGYEYYVHLTENLVPTEDQIRAYYDEHTDLFAEKDIYDDGTVYQSVRHILLQPSETDDEDEYTEAAWEACEKEAQALLDQWLAGEKTEESFAELANEHSTDPGSNTKGGLYEGVYEGQMVPAFNDWCFDESRQYGDYGIVKTDYGYHIMFYVESTPTWYYYAQTLAKDWVISNTVEELVNKYPAEVDYSKVVLGFVDQRMAG